VGGDADLKLRELARLEGRACHPSAQAGGRGDFLPENTGIGVNPGGLNRREIVEPGRRLPEGGMSSDRGSGEDCGEEKAAVGWSLAAVGRFVGCGRCAVGHGLAQRYEI